MFSSSISVPTDHLAKFLAIFGLVVFVVSSLSWHLNLSSHRQILFEHAMSVSKLSTDDELGHSESMQIKALNIGMKQITRETNRVNTFTAIFSVAGLLIMLYGFYKWVVVLQPKLDRLLDIQIEIANEELNKSRRVDNKKVHITKRLRQIRNVRHF